MGKRVSGDVSNLASRPICRQRGQRCTGPIAETFMQLTKSPIVVLGILISSCGSSKPVPRAREIPTASACSGEMKACGQDCTGRDMCVDATAACPQLQCSQGLDSPESKPIPRETSCVGANNPCPASSSQCCSGYCYQSNGRSYCG